jgi:glycolate oxidase FAD binding subunit
MGTSSIPRCTPDLLASRLSADAVQPWADASPDLRAQVACSVTDAGAIAAVVSPGSTDDLATMVALAHQYHWRLLLVGQGSKLDWGGLVQQPDVVVSTARLNRLVDHAVGDLTVTAEAGMRFADVQAVLATANQTLALDPVYPDQATLGGIVATADTGSLRQRYNGVRDMLLGLSFVRADGQVAKAGGRVVKNVAGYDLMKLMTGAYGSLGILTQVTLRVYPMPGASQTVVLTGAGDRIGQLARTVLTAALTPVAVDVLAGQVLRDLGLSGPLGLAVQFQTMPAGVTEQTSRITALAEQLGLTVATFGETAETTLWRQVRESIAEAPRAQWITCKIGVRPTAAVAALATLDQGVPGPWHAQIHAASGLGKLALDGGIAPAAIAQIRANLTAQQGFLTVLQAPTAVKQQLDVWGYTGNALDLMQRLKTQFDGQQVLNPQRFVGGGRG